jgi:hypothetical protein
MGVPKTPTLEAFRAAFATKGYVDSEDGELVSGLEKVAFYGLDGNILHAARQLPSGLWTSKIGQDVDIEHCLEDLEGPTYGFIVGFAERSALRGA